MLDIVNGTECKLAETIKELRLLPQTQFDEMLRERTMNFCAHLIENGDFLHPQPISRNSSKGQKGVILGETFR